ncbi:MAG TPA: DUF2298 domain-containing protein, partial [Caldilineaceae bacterium]|nr:DUF2298 domain-containing protein [Caldilineaceae bacterium]
RNTTPYLYFIRQQVQWGMGWPLGLVGLAGSLVMLIVLARTVARWLAAQGRLPAYEAANVLMWAWVIPYFGLTGAFLAKFNRYMSPVLPFVALFAAGALWLFYRGLGAGSREWGQNSRLSTALSPLKRWAAIGVALVAFGGGLFWSAAYVNGVYNHPHTWITASRWIYENVPRDSVILWELWDDPLPKAIPGEPGMDMGSAGLRNIDWSPYEEDTAEKYEILKAKLREADYVVYSSKRIYDSVDELPERYPMTNRYYEAMWDGRLGFELAQEVTSPPRLFGWVFDDRHADESWSLYDHPQVTIFRKVRDLSDAEFDAVFERSWERAIPYYRGKDSPLSPLLEALGLGSDPASAQRGLVGGVVGWLAGGEGDNAAPDAPEADLMLDQPPPALPLVDNYRWNRVASESPWLSVAVWWLVVGLLGWAAWPLAFALLPSLRDRGYTISKTLGWLVTGWLLWIGASSGLLHNTVRNAWLMAGLLVAAGAVAAWRQRALLGAWLRANWRLLLIGEALFALAYLLFVVVRMFNPDLWQPWFGGEKFMEFAFLNGILRSPTFPPVDPHFAGGYINYYYFGIYLVAYLVKLTGIYAEVAFNLAIPTLFAMTAINAFGLAYNAALIADAQKPASGAADSNSASAKSPVSSHQSAVLTALLAPLFVALLGNLDGFGQIVRNLAERSPIQVQSALPGVQALVAGAVGLVQVIRGEASLPPYDFWGPSRVIPNTINEFPYWSFLFADLHPHLIGIPLALLFLALLLGLVSDYRAVWRSWRRGAGLLIVGSFLLGTLASVNLWELPTYYGLGMLALLVCEYRALGRVRWPRLVAVALIYLAGAYLFYLPFFRSYVNVGASGIGWVKAGDDLGAWLLIWGFLGFVTASWILYSVAQRTHPARDQAPFGRGAGVERFARALLVRFDRLPRFLYLHSRLVMAPTFGYLLGILATPAGIVAALAALLWGRAALALCLVLLAFGLAALWRRSADGGAVLANLLSVTGLAILAGTQVIYLKDFLQGGDWYRMNTLFKFFVQVWVLWAVAAAIALPRLWAAANAPCSPIRPIRDDAQTGIDATGDLTKLLLPQNSRWLQRGWLPRLWQASCVLLLAASCAYLIWGTPARLTQRLVGWRPPFGTLNGLAYMDGGRYSWPDESHQIELRYDAEAIRWLLDNVRGNPVVVETAEVDYYRAGSSRVASLTGMSGLRGMHESEQRYGEQVGARDALHREFWTTPDIARTEAILDDLHVSLIYVGQLERYLHPEGVAKLEAMAANGRLLPVFHNERVTIYAVPGRLVATAGGYLVPQAAEPHEDLGRVPLPTAGSLSSIPCPLPPCTPPTLQGPSHA